VDELIHFENLYGEKLTGTLHRPDLPSSHAVIFGHCFTCTRHTSILRQICQDLAKLGFIALRFDFSGNGQSEGEFLESTYSKQISEMETAAELVSSYGVSWIGMAGHSLGASVALLAAAKRNTVKAVSVLAGRLSGLTPVHFLSKDQQGELKQTGTVFFSSRGRGLKLSTSFFSDAKQFDIPGILRSLSHPLLIVHGNQDEIVPVVEAEKAHQINPRRIELKVIRGADHMFSQKEHRRQVAGLVAGWFQRQVSIRAGRDNM